LIGGLPIVAGFLTRPAAFILAGSAAVAYFLAHIPQVSFRRSTSANQPFSTASYFSIWPRLAPARGRSTKNEIARLPSFLQTRQMK